MAKKKSVKKPTKVRSLPVRKGSSVKGGSISATFKNTVSTLGAGLETIARKQ